MDGMSMSYNCYKCGKELVEDNEKNLFCPNCEPSKNKPEATIEENQNLKVFTGVQTMNNSPISRNSGIAKISNNPQSSVSSTGQLGTEKDAVLHRILAVIIDYIVLGFSSLFLSASILASIVPGSATNPIMAPALGLMTIIMTLFLAIILWIPYGIILETWRGQTIGKMILGIVVVKENGEPCTFVAALLRNVLRIIDALPQSYLIGFIFMALSEKRQRIGDRLANTIVVRIKR
ncbi:MAG: RDD family protein [Candidatus Methanoperedens sp.]